MFANGFADRVTAGFADNDKKLRRLIRDWIDDANESDVNALLRADRRNDSVRDLFAGIRELRNSQVVITQSLVVSEYTALIQSEAAAISKALDGDYKVRPAEILNQPILGERPKDLWRNAVRHWYDMVLVGLTDAVQQGTNAVHNLFGRRGDKRGSQIYARDRRIERDVDTQVIGVGSNSRRVVYAAAKVVQEEWLSTLDHRVCLVCASLDGNVYKLGSGEHPPAHRRCRCIRIPAVDEPTERPFVEDERPVSNIPKDERDGKIGRTTLRYKAFFERQTEANKKKILGPTRYELYKNDGLKIDDFINDRTLKIKTIDELDRAS